MTVPQVMIYAVSHGHCGRYQQIRSPFWVGNSVTRVEVPTFPLTGSICRSIVVSFSSLTVVSTWVLSRTNGGVDIPVFQTVSSEIVFIFDPMTTITTTGTLSNAVLIMTIAAAVIFICLLVVIMPLIT
jgi:hypothetical protein